MLVEGMQKETAIVYQVEERESGRTLKQVLKGSLGISSRLLTKIKQGQMITINGQYAKYHEIVATGDLIHLSMEEPPNQFMPQNIPFQVVYEDVDLIIVNKQPGVVSHPTKSHPLGTMANGAAYYLSQRGIDCRIRFVNRLDMDTSGLLIIAKNPYAHHILSEQMQRNEVHKQYLTFVKGKLAVKSDIINAPIYRPTEDAIQRVVDPRGQESITQYQVLEEYPGASMLEVTLFTGRTHQIRVHLSHLGHPIIGDSLYGTEAPGLVSRQALQAFKLELKQPRYGHTIKVKAPLSEDLIRLKEKLQNEEAP